MYRLQGKTIKEIADMFGCSVGLIHKVISENNHRWIYGRVAYRSSLFFRTVVHVLILDSKKISNLKMEIKENPITKAKLKIRSIFHGVSRRIIVTNGSIL